MLAVGAAASDAPRAATAPYSIAGVATAPAPVGLTLLEPTWLLLPIESLETTAALDSPTGRAEVLLHEEALVPPRVRQRQPPAGRLAYPLSDDLTAQLRYRRSQIFGFSRSQAVRDDPSSGFSSHPDRDVVDLNMSWQLAGNTVGVGYQLQSSVHGIAGGETEAGFGRFMPGSPQATHSLSLGFTRQWGAAPPATLAPEVPLLAEVLADVAAPVPEHTTPPAVEPTPTP